MSAPRLPREDATCSGVRVEAGAGGSNPATGGVARQAQAPAPLNLIQSTARRSADPALHFPLFLVHRADCRARRRVVQGTACFEVRTTRRRQPRRDERSRRRWQPHIAFAIDPLRSVAKACLDSRSLPGRSAASMRRTPLIARSVAKNPVPRLRVRHYPLSRLAKPRTTAGRGDEFGAMSPATRPRCQMNRRQVSQFLGTGLAPWRCQDLPGRRRARVVVWARFFSIGLRAGSSCGAIWDSSSRDWAGSTAATSVPTGVLQKGVPSDCLTWHWDFCGMAQTLS